MKFVIALNFLTLSIIMVGLFYVVHTNYNEKQQTYKHWVTALLFDAVGLTLTALVISMSTDLSEPYFVGTVANTCLMTALIYQTASIRAIHQNLTKRQIQLIYFSIAFFTVCWHVLKDQLTVNQRLVGFAAIAVMLLLWQLFEVRKDAQKLSTSKQLRILFYSIVGEVLFTTLRIVGVLAVDSVIISAEQLPALSLFSVWIQYGLKIVAYVAMAGFWGEKAAMARAAIEIENKQFKELSERQKNMIAELGQINKVSTAGVFVASLAHEISQPLQGFILNNDLIFQELAAEKPNVNFLRSITENQKIDIERMVEIIGTIRTVFGSSKAAPQKINLTKLFEKLELIYGAEARKKGIKIEHENFGTTEIFASEGGLKQVILNIISNAFDALIESNTPNPTIKISIHGANNWVVCSIQDNGPGIPSFMHQEVFKLLKTTKSKGMGVGLWLSKFIIERDHGYLDTGPSPLGGAMFIIRFQQTV